jgi:hypothetical protein
LLNTVKEIKGNNCHLSQGCDSSITTTTYTYNGKNIIHQLTIIQSAKEQIAEPVRSEPGEDSKLTPPYPGTGRQQWDTFKAETIFGYDKYGNRTMEKLKTGKINITTYEYVYDKSLNWVSRVIKLNGVIETVNRRYFEY